MHQIDQLKKSLSNGRSKKEIHAEVTAPASEFTSDSFIGTKISSNESLYAKNNELSRTVTLPINNDGSRIISTKIAKPPNSAQATNLYNDLKKSLNHRPNTLFSPSADSILLRNTRRRSNSILNTVTEEEPSKRTSRDLIKMFEEMNSKEGNSAKRILNRTFSQHFQSSNHSSPTISPTQSTSSLFSPKASDGNLRSSKSNSYSYSTLKMNKLQKSTSSQILQQLKLDDEKEICNYIKSENEGFESGTSNYIPSLIDMSKKVATVFDLIFQVANNEEPDLDFIEDFILTYKYFTTSWNLVRALIIRYLDLREELTNTTSEPSSSFGQLRKSGTMLSVAKQFKMSNANNSQLMQEQSSVFIQLRILNFFKKWVDINPGDFAIDLKTKELLRNFLQLEIIDKDVKKAAFASSTISKIDLIQDNTELRDLLESAYEKQSEGNESPSIQNKKNKISLEEKILSLKFEVNFPNSQSQSVMINSILSNILQTNFINLDSDLIMKQLTLAEHARFKKIQLIELFKQNWNHKTMQDKLAPNIINSIIWFNRISYGVATMIVTTTEAKERAELLKKWIEISTLCISNHNYNTAFQIAAALALAPVARLKKTWKCLGKSTKESFNRLLRLLSTEENYIAYRAHLKTHMNNGSTSVTDMSFKRPVVPYLGVHLSDLTFAEDGNKNSVGEGNLSDFNAKINFTKFRLIAKILKNILAFQAQEYTWSIDNSFQYWMMKKFPVESEPKMYELSLKIEPREK